MTKKFQFLIGFICAVCLLAVAGSKSVQQQPGLSRGQADTIYVQQAANNRQLVTLAQVPFWSTTGWTPTYPFNLYRDSYGNWSHDLSFKATLPTESYDTNRYPRIYVDPVAGADGNTGQTVAQAVRNLGTAIRRTSGVYGLSITSITGTNPLTITTASAHNLANNAQVCIAGALGNTAANSAVDGNGNLAPWAITLVNATQFTIPATSNGTYTSGGVIALPRWVMVKPQAEFRFGNAASRGTPWQNADLVAPTIITTYEGSSGTSTWTSSMEYSDLTFSQVSGSPTVWAAPAPSAAGFLFDGTTTDWGGNAIRYTKFSTTTAAVKGQVGSWLTSLNANITGTTGNGVNPIVITTSVGHQLTTGDPVTISGVVGNTAANGTFVVTQINSTQFSIPATGNGAYVSGGQLGQTVFVNTGRTTAPGTELDVVRGSADGYHGDNSFRLWVRNANFTYGDRTFFISTADASTNRPAMVFENCSFRKGTTTAGLRVEGKCELYLINCIAEQNEQDGFSYRLGYAFELNCIGRKNGYLSATYNGDYRDADGSSYGTNQGSTTHKDAEVMRVGGLYWGNNQGVYDTSVEATICQSWMIGTYCYNQRGTAGVGKGNADYGIGSAATDRMYMIDAKNWSQGRTASTSTNSIRIESGAVAFWDLDLTIGGVSPKPASISSGSVTVY